MHINIRVAVESDFEEISQIFTEENAFHASLVPEFIKIADPTVTRQEFRAMLQQHDGQLIVAELKGIVVGVARTIIISKMKDRFLVPERVAYLQEITVLREYQGKGIGQLLMDKIADWAKSHDLTAIECHVWTKNEDAVQFYESLGYEIIQHKIRKDL